MARLCSAWEGTNTSVADARKTQVGSVKLGAGSRGKVNPALGLSVGLGVMAMWKAPACMCTRVANGSPGVRKAAWAAASLWAS